MAQITAAQFGKRYGAMCRTEYPDLNSTALSTALAARKPPIVVSRAVLEQWMKRSIKPADAITVSSSEDLQEKYGDLAKGLVAVHATAYKLCQALRAQSPAVYCSDGIAKQWIKKYGSELKYINSAGHLELHCGSRIRENDRGLLQAPELKVWLQTTLLVDASADNAVCRHTLSSGARKRALSLSRIRLPQWSSRCPAVSIHLRTAPYSLNHPLAIPSL